MPSATKTEALWDYDVFARKDLLLQQCGQRIEQLTQQDKLSKFCMDAGFLNVVVEVGQTKDTQEFSHFMDAVTCREYTLPRKEEASNQKVGSEGIPNLDPYWKLQPIACTVITKLTSELCLLTKTILTPGSESLKALTNWSRI